MGNDNSGPLTHMVTIDTLVPSVSIIVFNPSMRNEDILKGYPLVEEVSNLSLLIIVIPQDYRLIDKKGNPIRGRFIGTSKEYSLSVGTYIIIR